MIRNKARKGRSRAKGRPPQPGTVRPAAGRRRRKPGIERATARRADPELLPEIYQKALVESVTALEIVTQIIGRNLEHDDVRRILDGRESQHDDIFLDKLGELLRQTSGLLLVSRRMSDSQSLDVLLPRMVELISEFLAAERCTIFLHDADADELFTKAAVGLSGELRIPADHGIVGAVFRSGEPLIVDDAYSDPRFSPEVDQRTGFLTRSLLCVPLRHLRDGQSRIVGAVQVLNKKSGRFSAADLKLLDSLNAQAASAFVNAILQEEIQKAQAQEMQLLEISMTLATELSLQPLLLKIMDAVARLLEAERATLFLHDRGKAELWAPVGGPGGEQEIRFPSNAGIAGHVFRTGATINIADAYADERFNPELDRRTGFRTRSILCMPVINRAGETIGVTQVLNKRGGPFGPRDERRLRAFSAQASIAMQNAQLFDEADRVRRFNESILESITNGVLTVDASGCITKANTAALRLLGRLGAPEVVEGQPAPAFFQGANAWVAETVEEVQRSGEPSVVMDGDIALGEPSSGRRGARVTSVNLAALPFTHPRSDGQGCLLMIEDMTLEKRMKAALSRYMSKPVADRLLEEGEAALGGRLQKATVLFSDLRSFTALSERVGPQATVQLLNEYFSLMADVVLEHGGLLDKYIGDAIMAVFGVPAAGPRDADQAVATAVGMFGALRGYNERRAAAGQEPVRMGIGINSDEVVSGNIGSLKRMDYTVIGDGVNLAARIEKANRAYGTRLLVSELTVRELTRPVALRDVDKIRVRGKSQPVGIYEVLDALEADSPSRGERFLGRYREALASYQRREWRRARDAFAAALELHGGDAVSALYQRRCERFLQEPPPDDWDGVLEIEEK